MSIKVVRASKYRHVHGEPAKVDKYYSGMKLSLSGDGNGIKANRTFFAAPVVGGGGPVIIAPLAKTGRESAWATLNVHRTPVLDVDFNPFIENMIATGADDGTICVSMFPEKGIDKEQSEAAASLDGHQKKISFLHWHPTADNILASSSYDNTIKVWNVATSQRSYSFDMPDNVQSFEWNTNGSLLGATCKDKTVRIFDPRAGAQTTKIASGFAGPKAAKLAWADGLNKIVTTGFSQTSVRQYNIYDIRNFASPLASNDIDQSAGVFILYYDPDTSVLFLAGKGDAGIKYLELNNEEPYLHSLSEFRSNEGQKGACFLPKLACNTEATEIAVALRILSADKVQPVSFQVPRKSDMFQADIFPDTYAGLPVLSADEWLGGANKEPIKVSMKDKNAAGAAGASAPGVKVGGPKSNMELQKELAAAHDRIRALEAEVAALKAGK